MKTLRDGRYVPSFGWSLAVVSVLSALLVILKEKNEAVMALMKGATTHHWITQGLAVLVLFVVLGLVLARISADDAAKASDFNSLALAIVGSTIISGLILAGFFLPG
ncbi:MAG: hypothetical protein ACRERY_11110 [Pseudomonas sp.]